MGLTYSCAQTTICYVGEPDEHSNALASLPDEVPCTPGKRLVSGIASENARVHHKAFLGRAWFTRTWIIQEVLLSQTVTVQCGAVSIAWEKLQCWCQHFFAGESDLGKVVRLRMRTIPEYGMFYTGKAVFAAVVHFVPRFSLSIHELWYMMHDTWHFGCRDPRDHSYALLALCGDRLAVQLGKPDYKKHKSLVSTALCKRFRDAGLVEFLLYAQGCASRSTDSPSWVMDWRTARSSAQLASKKKALPMSASEYTYLTATADKVNDDETMEVSGWFMGRVDALNSQKMENQVSVKDVPMGHSMPLIRTSTSPETDDVFILCPVGDAAIVLILRRHIGRPTVRAEQGPVELWTLVGNAQEDWEHLHAITKQVDHIERKHYLLA
jgi:hypothetical protein